MTTTSQTTARRVTADSFWSVRAADLMTTPVLNIPHDTSLREAARLLHGNHISGAPVIDENGRCLGVLSSNDFVASAEDAESPGVEIVRAACFIAPWGEMIPIDDDTDLEIHHYMHSPPITVDATTPIGELAQVMVEAHIHRVLVTDDNDRPRGIITSTDVLTALAGAARANTGRDQNE